ncbi:hypothetical protein [Parapedobacter soli]|uniref:hypothetical protein n=1 Tax=Parapedobacter soli TaxID=416955 RepID=UPI0021C65434|nr:hypothetical protein [Parapedobacter soli]
MARGLKKGMTNNPNGRPKGIPNKVTSDLRKAIADLLDGNWPRVQDDLDALDPKDRLAFIEKLLSYSLPKLTSTTLDAKVETQNRLGQLSDTQLNILIDQIIEQNEGTEGNG